MSSWVPRLRPPGIDTVPLAAPMVRAPHHIATSPADRPRYKKFLSSKAVPMWPSAVVAGGGGPGCSGRVGLGDLADPHDASRTPTERAGAVLLLSKERSVCSAPTRRHLDGPSLPWDRSPRAMSPPATASSTTCCAPATRARWFVDCVGLLAARGGTMSSLIVRTPSADRGLRVCRRSLQYQGRRLLNRPTAGGPDR